MNPDITQPILFRESYIQSTDITNFLIFRERYIKKPDIFRTRSIFTTLVYLEPKTLKTLSNGTFYKN